MACNVPSLPNHSTQAMVGGFKGQRLLLRLFSYPQSNPLPHVHSVVHDEKTLQPLGITGPPPFPSELKSSNMDYVWATSQLLVVSNRRHFDFSAQSGLFSYFLIAI